MRPTRSGQIRWLWGFVTVTTIIGHAARLGVMAGEPSPKSYWKVEDVRAGMKGYGMSVFHGTEIAKFEAEVVGVQRNSSPGRDMILVRLKGCGLEQTGVVAGMSGSPIYVDGKLLGAVAYTWSYGKAPIAGVTPFCQMAGYARVLREQQSGQQGGRSVSAAPEVRVWERPFEPALAGRGSTAQSVWGLQRIKVPLIASGFSPRSLSTLSRLLGTAEMIPAIGGKPSNDVLAEAAKVPLKPGSPLAIAMVTGDFDLSSLGTVTHVEGDRVYGFGHPMFASGKCELPLMSGYIHVIYPRQSISFKMGSPLGTVGVIDTDVSTCVAGRLGPQPRMVPMQVVVKRRGQKRPHQYNVHVVREPTLLPSLVLTVLTAAVDTEGDLPEEMTATFEAEIKTKGHQPLRVSDVYSGPMYSGSIGPMLIYSVVPNVLNNLVRNPFEEVQIESIRCVTEIAEGRRTASIEKVRLNSDLYQPGDTVVAQVLLEPYKGAPKWVQVCMKLPDRMRPGRYQARLCDSITAINTELRNQPYLLDPQNLDQLYRVLELQLAEHRTNLYLQVTTLDVGVAVNGHAMPDLPLSVAQILSSRRTSSTLPIRTSLTAKVPTDYVVQGSRSIHFTVVPEKKVYR